MCLASVPIVCSQSLLRDLSCQQRGQGKQGNHPADDQSARVVWARQGPECSGEDRIYRCFLWVKKSVCSFWLPWELSQWRIHLNAGDLGLIPGLGRSLTEGNGHPLQHSCLENPMNRGAWWATVHGVQRVRHDLATKSPPLVPVT